MNGKCLICREKLDPGLLRHGAILCHDCRYPTLVQRP